MLRKFAKSASDALPDPLTTANHSPTFPYLQVLKSKLIITHPASIGCSLLPAHQNPQWAKREEAFASCHQPLLGLRFYGRRYWKAALVESLCFW